MMSGEVHVRLPDGSVRAMPEASTGSDLAASIGRRLAKDAVALKVDGVEVDLGAPLVGGSAVEILTPTSPAGREVLRHSTSHVLPAGHFTSHEPACVHPTLQSPVHVTSHAPAWLQIDGPNSTGKIIALPKREDVNLPVNEQMIVELYSK